MGIEKLRADLARPRGVPAAAAPLLDRRADEPVHLAVDRRHPRRRAAGRSTWCCWTTAGPRRSPTGSGRAALHCIRCSACLNVCPVYERTGGHAYGSVYPGPIGAVLSPQLTGMDAGRRVDTLPYASSLCGACYDVCPVKIDIPALLVHLRAEHVEARARRTAGCRRPSGRRWPRPRG